MKFDINKVICINFKRHDDIGLKSISEHYKLNYDALKRTKERGTWKIWIESGGDWAIAAIDTNNEGDFYICEKFCPLTTKERKLIKNIQPINTPKRKFYK